MSESENGIHQTFRDLPFVYVHVQSRPLSVTVSGDALVCGVACCMVCLTVSDWMCYVTVRPRVVG